MLSHAARHPSDAATHTPNRHACPPTASPPHPGGGCGVGVGLGWGFGAAWGSKYIIVDPEFGDANSAAGKPRWFSQLQQQLRIAKFEHNHAHEHRTR